MTATEAQLLANKMQTAWAAKHLGFYTPPPKKERVKEKPDIIGSAQRQRADDTYKKLSKEDQSKYNAVKKAAKSDSEREYLDKALASQYSVKDIEKFAKKINGKDETWIQDNLKLTGNSKGKGVKQQWSMSCNATTVQALRGQLDPIYALKLHEENKDVTDADDADGTKMNKKLAAEQKKLLESEYSGDDHGKHSGEAKSRGSHEGGGRFADDLMNDISEVTGVEYGYKSIDGTDYTIDDAIKEVEKGLKVGHPVPLIIGNSAGSNAHYVLATGFGEKKAWMIHDPWDGVTVERKVSDIKGGKVNVAGWSNLNALDVPTTKKDKKK